jgi:cell wall-associated NlpC family hydrolase
MKKLKKTLIFTALVGTLHFGAIANENPPIEYTTIVYNDINFTIPTNQEQSVKTTSSSYKTFKETVMNVLSKSLSYIGTPYKWGGSTESGFDCSGFVQFVYENSIGINLPRTAKEMSEVGTIIKNFKDLMPGDLVFFNTRKFNFSHVGIYLGDNKFIHAPRTGYKVKVEDMEDSYWIKRFNGARRLM